MRPRTLRRLGGLSVLGLVASLLIAGCVPMATNNPAWRFSADEIRADYKRLRAEPGTLERPVVVLSGYRSLHSMAERTQSRLIKLTTGERDDFLAVSYPFAADIGNAVDKAIRVIEERWPSDDPDETVEVDVVAISMGGLVARVAALPPEVRPRGSTSGKRLNIRRVFTLASPHRGANLARFIRPDQAARDMRPGSDFLNALDALDTDRPYELVPYANLRDTWVGATRTAPIGMEPIWTGGTFMFSHFAIPTDRRVLTDVARRLRGETPIAEPSPPPRD